MRSKEQGGVKPIYVLKPKPYLKVKLVDRDGQTVEEHVKAVSFETAIVYSEESIDQAHKRVPEFFLPIKGDADALCEKIIELMAEDGIEVIYSYIGYHTEGASAGKKVYIRPDVPSVNRLYLLLHEYSHSMLHWGEDRPTFSKTTKECQAELCCYLISSYLGLPSPISGDYLRMYGVSGAILRENLKASMEFAHSILERLEKDCGLFAEFEYKPEEQGERTPYKRKTYHKSRRKK